MKITLDAKLDLREGAMWTQVDSYLNRFAGDGDSDEELHEAPGTGCCEVRLLIR